MGRFEELSALLYDLHCFYWFCYKAKCAWWETIHGTRLDNYRLYFLKKYTLCHVGFCRIINVLFARFKRCWYFILNMYLIDQFNQILYVEYAIWYPIKCMKRTLFPPLMWMLCTIFEKVKFYLFHWKFAFPSVITWYVLIMKNLVPVTHHPSQIYFVL